MPKKQTHTLLQLVIGLGIGIVIVAAVFGLVVLKLWSSGTPIFSSPAASDPPFAEDAELAQRRTVQTLVRSLKIVNPFTSQEDGSVKFSAWSVSLAAVKATLV